MLIRGPRKNAFAAGGAEVRDPMWTVPFQRCNVRSVWASGNNANVDIFITIRKLTLAPRIRVVQIEIEGNNVQDRCSEAWNFLTLRAAGDLDIHCAGSFGCLYETRAFGVPIAKFWSGKVVLRPTPCVIFPGLAYHAVSRWMLHGHWQSTVCLEPWAQWPHWLKSSLQLSCMTHWGPLRAAQVVKQRPGHDRASLTDNWSLRSVDR